MAIANIIIIISSLLKMKNSYCTSINTLQLVSWLSTKKGFDP